MPTKQPERFVPSSAPPPERHVVTPGEAAHGLFPLDRIVEIARRYPDDVMVIPVAANTHELVRANDKHGDGLVKVKLPDRLVVNLRGEPTLRDLLFLVHIPRRLVDIGESRIVLPQEAPIPQPPPRRK